MTWPFKKREVGLPQEYYPEARDEVRLPEELQTFKAQESQPETSQSAFTPFGFATPEPSPQPVVAPSSNVEKIDLVLQKLETIDARLKLLEEKFHTRAGLF